MTDADWIARERALAEQRAHEERQRREGFDRDMAKLTARIRAHGCVLPDDPTHCQFCGTEITYDSQDRPMHPDNDCRGPEPAPCAECHTRTVWNANRKAWEPGCSPAEHDALRSTRKLVQLVRTRDAAAPDILSLGRNARRDS